jgi:predicted phosphodiesterase
MRYLILSDIHANVRALETVLRHAQKQGWEKLVFLGDLVGYGPEPEAAVRLLRDLQPYVALKGNHEAMVLATVEGGAPPHGGEALRIARRHAGMLSAESLEFLRALKDQHLDNTWGAVHGALRRPWDYLISVPKARASLPLMQRDLYFVGHTHVASAFILTPEPSPAWQSRHFPATTRFSLSPGAKAFVNPGAVSEPRDGLPSPGYAIFDSAVSTIEVFRI